MKSLTRSARMVAVVGASALLADAVGAQMVNGVAQPPQKPSSTRQGIMVTPPPPPRPSLPVNPSFPNALITPIPVHAAQPVQFTLVPAILMSDGSILANFGFGFEPVVRSCASPGVVVVVGGTPKRVASNGVAIPNRGASPPSTVSQPQIVLSSAAQSACFTRDSFGRVFVYRRS